MRVIAGKYKKRQLKVPKSQLTRPTTDKIMKTFLYDWTIFSRRNGIRFIWR